MMHQIVHDSHEKTHVALVSLLAAAGLTAAKLVIGILTNSLGIISEALHSGLDLVATGMTLWAVRIAERPPDAEHRYGHGKYENLSALGETLLLLVVCVWVIYEAIHRLFFRGEVEITPSVWAYVVILGSIAVDLWRSHRLKEAAEKHNSQALEADALHFASDVWSSLVVLGGLIGVSLSEWLGWPWLMQADSVAAIIVSVLVAVVCLRLGKRAVDALTDRTSRQLTGVVERSAIGVEGVEGVRNVRVRQSGPSVFADMTILVPRDLGLEKAHAVAQQVSSAVQSQIPGADVVVHVEPVARPDEDLVTSVRMLANSLGLAVHDVRTFRTPEGNSLELHVEVDARWSLEQAHDRVSELESQIKNDIPEVTSVLTHIEPEHQDAGTPTVAHPEDPTLAPYQEAIGEFSRAYGSELSSHQLSMQETPQGKSLTFHLSMDGQLSIGEAHEISRRLERFLHQRFPQLARITVHLEPHDHRDECACNNATPALQKTTIRADNRVPAQGDSAGESV
jgi:cation diffusion facilitator family transporter